MKILSRFSKKKGIAGRLAMYIVLFSSFIAVITTLVQLFMDYRHDIDQIENHMAMFKTVYLKSLTNSVWVWDETQLNIQLEGLLRLRDVEYIEIRPASGSPWSSGSPKSKHKIVTEIPMIHSFRGHDYSIGVLRVQASLDSVYQRLLDKALVILLGNAAKTFLVAGFILMIFHFLVTRHLNQAAGYFERLDFDPSQPPLELNRKTHSKGPPDELDQLVTAINTMRQKMARYLLDREKAEKDVRESQQQLQTILDSLEGDVYVSDPDTDEILFVNQRLEKTFGQGLVGQKCWRVFRNEENRCPHCPVPGLREEGGGQASPVVHEEFNPVSGRWYRNQDQMIQWVDGRLVHLHLAMDIQERKRAEQESRRLSSLVENNIDFIGLFDIKGQLVYVNQAGGRMVGLKDREKATGRPLADFLTLETAKRLGENFLESILEHGSWTGQMTLGRLDSGDPIPVDAHFFMVQDPDVDRPSCLAAVMRDISERIAAEEEKEVLAAQLRHTQKMEAIGALAGGIAHDFNNILAAIIGFNELALLDLPENGLIAQNLRQAIQAGSRAKELVQQILTFSRKLHHEKRLIDLHPLVRESVGLLRAFLPATVDIREHLADGRAVVEADPTQIHQVLMNLGANAGQAMGEKGGILAVGLSRVELSASRDELSPRDLDSGEYIRLSVSDTGAGIEPEALERIFEPFFSTKDLGKGTGMGLAVVHGILKSHNGGIAVESALGKGSTFHVFLPASNQPVGNQPSPQTTALPGGRERILFVDDENSLVDVARQMLERLGYTVVGKTDSREALAVFTQAPDQFDLIVTDQTMPNMTGLDLARLAKEIRPEIPIILCSGYSARLSGIKAGNIGVEAILIKPLIIKDFAGAIRSVLDGKAGEPPGGRTG